MKYNAFFRGVLFLLIFLMLTLALPIGGALADDAGVLTEVELGDWVRQVLMQSQLEQLQNAPVGEESRTAEGYAFMYPFATLYYDKPVLDAQSVVQGFSVTDEAMETPRGIRLGSPVEALIAAYGWENPELYGDGSFAALYTLHQGAQGVYWAWAELNEGQPMSVRCAVHAAIGTSGKFTDAGVLYQLQDGVVASIQVYGLSQTMTLADAESNLRAVLSVQSAARGDEHFDNEATFQTAGYYQKSDASPFDGNDLVFAGIDFFAMDQASAQAAFGAQQGESWVQDDTGEWLQVLEHPAATLTYVTDANKQNARLESISIMQAGLMGPRGIQIGDSLDAVAMKFQSDGTGETRDGEALLYGDGRAAPYGALMTSGYAATLRYAAIVQDTAGFEREIIFHLAFSDGRLTEILLYSW